MHVPARSSVLLIGGSRPLECRPRPPVSVRVSGDPAGGGGEASAAADTVPTASTVDGGATPGPLSPMTPLASPAGGMGEGSCWREEGGRSSCCCGGGGGDGGAAMGSSGLGMAEVS